MNTCSNSLNKLLWKLSSSYRLHIKFFPRSKVIKINSRYHLNLVREYSTKHSGFLLLLKNETLVCYDCFIFLILLRFNICGVCFNSFQTEFVIMFKQWQLVLLALLNLMLTIDQLSLDKKFVCFFLVFIC